MSERGDSGVLHTKEQADTLKRLAKFINAGSYSVLGQHPNGYLFVELNFAKWEGRRGVSIFCEGLWMLWRIFREKLFCQFTGEAASPSPEGTE